MGYIKGKSEGDLVRDTMEGIVEGLTDGPTRMTPYEYEQDEEYVQKRLIRRIPRRLLQ